jgi:hypothetical protein
MTSGEFEPSDDEVAALQMESAVNPDETDEARMRRLLRENGPKAIVKLVTLMQKSTNERVQVDIAKYITDRVLGKIGTDMAELDGPLAKLFRDAEEAANAGKDR